MNNLVTVTIDVAMGPLLLAETFVTTDEEAKKLAAKFEKSPIIKIKSVKPVKVVTADEIHQTLVNLSF